MVSVVVSIRMRPSEIGAVAITRFSLQSTAGMSENSGTDARFPYEHRQNVVVRLCMFLLLEQEVPGSNPGAPTEVQPQALRCGDTTTHFAMRVRCRTPLQ